MKMELVHTGDRPKMVLTKQILIRFHTLEVNPNYQEALVVTLAFLIQ